MRRPSRQSKKDGSLHAVNPVSLVVGLMKALEASNKLDISKTEGIVLGCVTVGAIRVPILLEMRP